MMISQEGKITRLRVGDIRDTGRAAQGVKLQGLEPKDRVAAVTTLVIEEGDVAAPEGPEAPEGEPEEEPGEE